MSDKKLGITRKDFLRGAVSVASMGLLMSAGTQAAQKSRPKKQNGEKFNILFICSDQERNIGSLADKIGLPGHARLKAMGTSFENYHVNTSPCGPSRSVIYTGQHTQKTGVYSNPNSHPMPQLSTDMPTIGTMLGDHGYYTAYKGKWHISNINDGRDFRKTPGGIFPNSIDVLEPYGFKDYQFDGEKVGLTWEGHMQDGPIASDSSAWLREAGAKTTDSPWFLAVNFVNPHDIMFYDATGDQSESRLKKNWIAPMKGLPGDALYHEDLGIDLPVSYYKDDLKSKPEAHQAITDTQAIFYGKIDREDIASWKRLQNYYYNAIRDLDRHIMTVLDTLEASGQMDNTIIIYTSDHGERAGAHGMRQKGGTIYREDSNVPMIICHPDIEGGKSCDKLFSAIDIAPTLLGLAGVSSSDTLNKYPNLKGVDVSKLVKNPSMTTERDDRGLLYNYACTYGWNSRIGAKKVKPTLSLRRLHRGIHDGHYKFARYFAPSQHHIPKTWDQLLAHNDLELYDTHKDPHELTNLAADPKAHKDTIMRLNQMVNQLIADEIGIDNGSEYYGAVEDYNTLKL